MFNVISPMQNYTRVTPSRISRQAHLALVFHTVDGNTVTTKHDIDSDNKLCAGTVVEPIDIIEATLQASAAQSKGADQARSVSQIMPTRVVVDDHQHLIWHSKAAHREMWFAGRECGTHTLRVWWPNLLFKLDKRSSRLFVFALATGARPKANTRIYQAPLMNVNGDGSLCVGSARLPRLQSSANIVAMENCLYDSNFSHLNDETDNTLTHMQSDKAHVRFYRNRQQSGVRFTAKELALVGRLHDLL